MPIPADAPLNEQFSAAATAVKSLSEAPSNLIKLKLYGLFRQAQGGDVEGERPGAFDFVGGAKYDAWAALKGTSPEEAQRQYVALVQDLLDACGQ